MSILNKFELRAKQAIETDPRISVMNIEIKKDDCNFQKKLMWRLIFTFYCPCGNYVTEFLFLPDLWKSRFDQTLRYLRAHIGSHLVQDGFL